MTSVEETRREIESARAELDATLGRLEDRVHHELDWKARIRRNRTTMLIGGAGLIVVLAAGVAGARARGWRRHRGIEAQLKDLTHFDDVKREVVRLRDQMASRGRSDQDPLWQKLALAAAGAFGSAAGEAITKTVVHRFEEVEP